jgi:thiamine kinase-like enzyme
MGLVHGDVCPENLVVDASGRLRVIDTDSLAVRAKEYDLARTWYRWPMTREERGTFEDGYPEPAVLASYHEHFSHWALSILIRAASFRLRHALPDAEMPARRLREFLLCA